MTKTKRVKENLLMFLRRTTTSDSAFNYGVIYGLFSIIIVMGKQIFSIIFLKREYYVNINLFWAIMIYLMILFAILLVIHIKRVPSTNKLANLFIKLYPYFFVILGLLIVFAYEDYISGLLSFVAIAFVLFWIQIYSLVKRITVFSSLSIGFILFSHLRYGDSIQYNDSISIGIMVFVLMFISSSIVHQIHYTHQMVIKDFRIQNENVLRQKNELTSVYESLSVSKKITETMLGLTQQVLQNEKIDDVLQLVLDNALKLIPHSHAGSILLAENDTEDLRFVAANGYDLRTLKQIRIRKDESFQAVLEDKYEPYIVTDLEKFNEGKIGEDRTEKLRNRDNIIAKSCLTCSFKYEGEFFGSINVDNFEAHDVFSENDKYLMKQLAQEIEIIITVHSLYEKATRPTKYDDLTQAKTRRYCVKLLNQLIKNNPTDNISICTIDINNLKTVNDKYGHDVGDKYLFEFAEAVRNAKIKENIFGRIGGDEFLLIFHNEDIDGANNQIQIIRDYLQQNLFKSNDFITEIKFACGVSLYSKESKNVDELIRLSDKRMYLDKNAQKK